MPEELEEEAKPRSAPVFVSKPEPCTVEEGEWARFCCRVTGHPRPRVMWLINDNTVVNGSRYKLTYDGMYHMDIPKTRQYDTGKVKVIARSSVGEASSETELKIIPRHDDYRNVLKNAPRRKFIFRVVWNGFSKKELTVTLVSDYSPAYHIISFSSLFLFIKYYHYVLLSIYIHNLQQQNY